MIAKSLPRVHKLGVQDFVDATIVAVALDARIFAITVVEAVDAVAVVVAIQ